jgi:hypothetical protein
LCNVGAVQPLTKMRAMSIGLRLRLPNGVLTGGMETSAPYYVGEVRIVSACLRKQVSISRASLRDELASAIN